MASRSCCACSRSRRLPTRRRFALSASATASTSIGSAAGRAPSCRSTRARPLRYRLADFDLTFEFLPTDFVQVNPGINAELVATALRLAAVEPTDRVLDLFCGLGNFSLPLARQAAELLGVEGEAGLVARAVRNAASNGITNARFITADLMAPDWSFYREPWDVVLLDPPRTGAEAPVAELHRSSPRRIVYVSCHPATLARDAQVLVERHGYKLRAARVFDMFPHTNHVEALALFTRD